MIAFDIPPDQAREVRMAERPRFTLDGREVAVDFAPALPRPFATPAPSASGKRAGFAIATLKHPIAKRHADDTSGLRWAKSFRHHAVAGTGLEFLGALAQLTRESETGEIDLLFVFGHARQGTLCMSPNNGFYYPRNTVEDGYLEEGEAARDFNSLERFLAGPFPPVRFAEDAIIVFTGCNVAEDVKIGFVTYDSIAAAFANRIVPGGTVYAAEGRAEGEWARDGSGKAVDTGWFVSVKRPWRKWVKGREIERPWTGKQPEGLGRMTAPNSGGSNKLKAW